MSNRQGRSSTDIRALLAVNSADDHAVVRDKAVQGRVLAAWSDSIEQLVSKGLEGSTTFNTVRGLAKVLIGAQASKAGLLLQSVESAQQGDPAFSLAQIRLELAASQPPVSNDIPDGNSPSTTPGKSNH